MALDVVFGVLGLVVLTLGAVTPLWRRYAERTIEPERRKGPGEIRWGIQNERVARAMMIGTGMLFLVISLLDLIRA